MFSRLSKKKGCKFFAPYSNHFLGKHAYKKVDGFSLFPCESREGAIATVGELLEMGHFRPHEVSGIFIFGGPEVLERITIGEINTALKASKKNQK